MTTTDLPQPYTTPEIDCRDLDGFMLNAQRLLASELWALSTGEEFKAAVGLWCRAWQQTPAGSLPNDDRVLASFAGVPPARWRKVREMAMRGFVLCSDGRLYHPVLCADARRAWAAKEKRKADREAEATRLRLWREARRNGRSTPPETGTETGVGNGPETRTKPVRQDRDGTGTGQGQDERQQQSSSTAAAAPPLNLVSRCHVVAKHVRMLTTEDHEVVAARLEEDRDGYCAAARRAFEAKGKRALVSEVDEAWTAARRKPTTAPPEADHGDGVHAPAWLLQDDA